MKCKIEGLDWCIDQEHIAVMMSSAARSFDVQIIITDLEGPGGDWPVINVYGSYQDLIKWVRDAYCGGDDEEAGFICSKIERV